MGILLLRLELIFCVSLSIDWFQLGLGVSGRGCVVGTFLRFGPLPLRSSLQWVTLVLVSSALGVLLWLCLHVLLLVLRGFLA